MIGALFGAWLVWRYTRRRRPVPAPVQRPLALPAVLSAEPVGHFQSCLCLCSVRHGPGTLCRGDTSDGGVRIRLNSLYDTGEGVVVCVPCAAAWPELAPMRGA